jgi:UDP-N-acetyl-D-mannosaminuronate dehydrogenase
LPRSCFGDNRAQRAEDRVEKRSHHVAGVAYKNNVDDLRESPALTIIELLQKKDVPG